MQDHKLEDSLCEEAPWHRSRRCVCKVTLALVLSVVAVLSLCQITLSPTPLPSASYERRMLQTHLAGQEQSKFNDLSSIMLGHTAKGIERSGIHPVLRPARQYGRQMPMHRPRAMSTDMLGVLDMLSVQENDKLEASPPLSQFKLEPAALSLEHQLCMLADATKSDAGRTYSQAYEIERFVKRLEEFGQPKTLAAGTMDGTWNLVYASCPVHRASPFSWVFNKLVREVSAVQQAGFSESLPVFRVGTERQKIDGSSLDGLGSLESAIEVEVSVGPYLFEQRSRWMIKTTAVMQPDSANPDSLILVLQNVQATKKKDLLSTDMVTFPILKTFDVKHQGSTTMTLKTSYLSPSLRITRSPTGDVLVYARVPVEAE
eukprot:gnl/TRDRNA2_/TRDRNA2_87998_c0_seq1.p1 gnl/TRDRNA2_/TRDRNA2_87998_c0~~gnl/TRDRNA2_/TRDRNA2_87998_c0_seq1.p1  ORF type:complete len:373 (+),score=55.87 gnl/TRDRNA2_/TRDRNA2_87998_c0_seq1:54-1172(+)